MRIVSVSALPHRHVDAHGSRGFRVGGLALTAEAHLVAVSLRPGGVIGRHPAAGRQLFLLVSGDAVASGEDGSPVQLSTGQAAVWEPGEQHEVRTEHGLTALVVEGELDVADPSRPEAQQL